MRLIDALTLATAVGLGIALAIPETFVYGVHSVDTSQWVRLMDILEVAAVLGVFLLFSAPVIKREESKD